MSCLQGIGTLERMNSSTAVLYNPGMAPGVYTTVGIVQMFIRRQEQKWQSSPSSGTLNALQLTMQAGCLLRWAGTNTWLQYWSMEKSRVAMPKGIVTPEKIVIIFLNYLVFPYQITSTVFEDIWAEIINKFLCIWHDSLGRDQKKDILTEQSTRVPLVSITAFLKHYFVLQGIYSSLHIRLKYINPGRDRKTAVFRHPF